MQTLRFPQDVLKFLYWIFFKPITFNNYLSQIDSPLSHSPSILTFWRQRKAHPEFHPLVFLSLFHILVMPWILGFLTGSVISLVGFDVNWSGVVVGIALGIVVGIAFGLASGVAGGVAYGVVGGIAAGMALGMSLDSISNVTAIIIFIMACGFGATFSVAFWRKDNQNSIVFNLVIGVGIVGIALGISNFVGLVEGGSIMFGVVGVAIGLGFMAGYFRVFLYIFEVPWMWLHSLHSVEWISSPLTWDEIIWLPLLGLDNHLINIGRNNRKKGIEIITEVASSFGQRWAAKKAMFVLMIDDVEAATTLETISILSDTLGWLPQDIRDLVEDLILDLTEISLYASAALESKTSYNRQEQLRLGLNHIDNLWRSLVTAPHWSLKPRLISALGNWENIFTREYVLAQKEKSIPNIYVAGTPLVTESRVFKGRQDIFQTLERELVSPADQRPALLLFGARRMGKTSVLRQLPISLGPQVIPVIVDLQSVALSENVFGLLTKFAESIQSNALINRHITLPHISLKGLETDPYRTFSDWMELISNSIDNRWMLICLDEYEHLEKLLNDGRIDERAFQLLRTLIQNHPRLTLLFSGTHTLEDLKPMWSNYLLNVRIIKIKPLSEEAAETLITNPIPDFPLVYDREALTHILYETGRHPYLIQATCQDLVHRLNEAKRFSANLKDVEQALDSTLESGAGYFNDLWDGMDSDELQRAIQIEIAKAKTGRLSISRLETALTKAGFKKTETQLGINHLIHRDVLEQDDSHMQFRFNLIRRWVRYQKLNVR